MQSLFKKIIKTIKKHLIGFKVTIKNILEFIVKFSCKTRVSLDSLQGKGNFLFVDKILMTLPFLLFLFCNEFAIYLKLLMISLFFSIQIIISHPYFHLD